MKIIHISDTHGCHRRLKDLPPGDILVHSGDFTMTGSEREALDFLEWFCDLSYAHKIFICGNHDHTPAYGILDLDNIFGERLITNGSEELLSRISDLKLKVHLFGHIHRQHGITEQNGIIFSNGAIMNDDYSNINSPNIIEI